MASKHTVLVQTNANEVSVTYHIEVLVQPDAPNAKHTFTSKGADSKETTYYVGQVQSVSIGDQFKTLAFSTIPIGFQPVVLQSQAAEPTLATISAAVQIQNPQTVLSVVPAEKLKQHDAEAPVPSVVSSATTSSTSVFPPSGPTSQTRTPTPKPKGPGNPGPTEPPNSAPAPSNTGPVVGAAIGCLIAGLLVGFLIAFFIYKKRSQRRSQYAPPPTVVESKAFDAPPPPPVIDDKLSRFLLDASPDKEITAELRSLGTLIQQHVENNYHLNPVQADPRSLAALLTQLGITSKGSGLPQEVLANLALDPRTRQVALQHVISQVLFTSIDVSSRSRLSMLPAPVAAFLHSIPPRETGERNNEVLSTALNQWRALSAFILHPSRSLRTPLPLSTAAVSAQASSLADALDTFLHYFVDDSHRFQQTSHLQAVITELTKFGYVLLSQPHEWRVVNEPGPGHHTGLHGYNAVVCAGLVKVPLKDGTPTSSPQQVVPPMTVTV
ncbi:hypothetical protein V8F20_010318 [Naviculisporaceae sp. PSN 640]